MKLLTIFKDLLKEESQQRQNAFVLRPDEILKGLIDQFMSLAIVKKLIDRKAVSPNDIEFAVEKILGATMKGKDSVEEVIKDLDIEQISKTELDELKRELSILSTNHSGSFSDIKKVGSAIFKALEGDDSFLRQLSSKEIDSYLKYYTSDIMDNLYGMRKDPNYSEFLDILKNLKNK